MEQQPSFSAEETNDATRPLRLFFHVNDYEPDKLPPSPEDRSSTGFARLRHLIALSDPLVVWAPSGRLMERSDSWGPEGRTLFIDLVRKGRVRVAGRASWLRNEEPRRNHSWPFAKWDDSKDSFDEALKELIPRGEPDDSSPVIAGPEDHGRAWASRWLFDDKRHRRLQHVMTLLTTGKVPEGTASRARARASDEEKAVEIVRDAFNHLEAGTIARADSEALGDEAEFYRLMEEVRSSLAPRTPAAEEAAIREGLETLATVDAVHLVLDVGGMTVWA